MATEFFAEAGNSVAITLTPGDGGVLQVLLNRVKIFDKSDEGHPDLSRVKQMRTEIREHLQLSDTV